MTKKKVVIACLGTIKSPGLSLMVLSIDPVSSDFCTSNLAGTVCLAAVLGLVIDSARMYVLEYK